MILNTVGQFIEQEQLLHRNDKILVALSGGADSVALLRILLHLGYPIEAAHCNFHLRGTESDRDEEFVFGLCNKYKIRLHTQSFHTVQYANQHGISIEMAARKLRYAWFEKLSKERELQKIAVAHHRDDSVETVLLNLIRGTGIAGLTGIKPINGIVVRPLLAISRKDILVYLDSIGQSFRTDHSNEVEDFVRNKIRLSVLPLLESINPSVRKSILQTSNNLSHVEAVYRFGVHEAIMRVFKPDGNRQTEGLPEGVVSIEKILLEPSPEALLYELLSPYGFVSAQIKDIDRSMKGQSGKRFKAGNWVLLKDRNELFLYNEHIPVILPEFNVEEKNVDSFLWIPKDPTVACIDADRVKTSLSLRKWMKGDWFIPFGMKGKKLVSDFLTDRKKSVREKEQQLILTDGDQIVWLVGERLDNRYRVSDKTKRMLLIRIKE